MRIAAFRSLAVLLLVFGFVIFWLPIPLGAVMIAGGLAILRGCKATVESAPTCGSLFRDGERCERGSSGKLLEE